MWKSALLIASATKNAALREEVEHVEMVVVSGVAARGVEEGSREDFYLISLKTGPFEKHYMLIYLLLKLSICCDIVPAVMRAGHLPPSLFSRAESACVPGRSR